MAAVWCLLLVVVGCAATPERSEGNVFPPYKPIFSPEEWKEIMQLLNITKRDPPHLYDDTLTYKQILELIKQHSTLYQNLVGKREHAPHTGERSEGNVFPPYKPIFSQKEWEEIWEILQLNITKRDLPPLYDDPLTYEQILELIKQHSTLYQNLIDKREHAPHTGGETRNEPLHLYPNLPEEILMQLELALEYDEILAILGEYLKG